MATKFLDDNGLLYFWQKLKAKFAPLASPAFTGTPTAPTATAGDSSTQIATTAFVTAAVTAGSGEVNQNAFSNVKVGSSTIAADSKTDTLELVAGSNVTLTPDTSNDKVTIAATDTTYSDFVGATSSTAAVHGLVPSFDHEAVNVGDSVLFGDGVWGELWLHFLTDTISLYRLNSNNTNDELISSITIPTASSSGKGLMSLADFTKLSGIASGAEVNQNAFSKVKVGSTTVQADSKTDTLELVAGSNVTLTPDATNDKVTIAATDTTYSNASSSADGLMSSTDKAKLDSISVTNGIIDSSSLPSYVDDVIEAYPRTGQTELSSTWLATESASGTVITPEAGKIYVLMADSTNYAANTQFRWGGSAYVKLADGGVTEITNAEIDVIVAS